MATLRGYGRRGAQQAGLGGFPLIQVLAKTLGQGSAAQAAWPHTGGNLGGDSKSLKTVKAPQFHLKREKIY